MKLNIFFPALAFISFSNALSIANYCIFECTLAALSASGCQPMDMVNGWVDLECLCADPDYIPTYITCINTDARCLPQDTPYGLLDFGKEARELFGDGTKQCAGRFPPNPNPTLPRTSSTPVVTPTKSLTVTDSDPIPTVKPTGTLSPIVSPTGPTSKSPKPTKTGKPGKPGKCHPKAKRV